MGLEGYGLSAPSGVAPKVKLGGGASVGAERRVGGAGPDAQQGHRPNSRHLEGFFLNRFFFLFLLIVIDTA